MPVAFVGIYTAIGTGIDAAIQGRTVIYRAPRVTLTLRPSGVAAGVTLRGLEGALSQRDAELTLERAADIKEEASWVRLDRMS